MRFRMLGLLEVTAEDGRRVPIGRGQESALLALLLLQRSAPISHDRIIDELWSGSAPANARKSVHIYISRLRKALGSERIETTPAGYRLVVSPPELLDLNEFDGLVEQGRAALQHGEAERSYLAFEQALLLWRGEALADFRFDSFAQHEIRRLDELRTETLADLIDAQLAAGKEEEAVPTLRRLIKEQPLWERPRKQLMLALYRGGRQAEALAVFREMRQKLDEELALEPSADLQALERSILNHDPQLGRPRRAPEARRHRRDLLLLAVGGALLLAAAAGAAVMVATRGSSSGGLTQIAPNSLGAIDPGTNRLVAQLPLGSSPTAVSVDSNSVWVADGARHSLLQIDGRRLRVVRNVPLASTPTALASGSKLVWATNPLGPESGSLSQVDVRSGAVRQVVLRTGFVADLYAPSTPNALALGGGAAVWTNSVHHELVRFARTVQRFPIHGGHSIDALAVGAGSIWIASSVDDSVLRFDPRVGRVVAVVKVASVQNRRAAGPAAIAFGFGSIWVADSLDDRVTRIDPRTQAVVATIPVDHRPTALAIGAGGVWTLNTGSGTVSHIDPAANKVLAAIPVGRVLTGIAASSSRVWVSVAGGSPPPTSQLPSPARPVRNDRCAPIESGGSPADLVLVSDLPRFDDGGSPNEQILDMVTAIRAVMRAHGFRAGPYRVGYQHCTDSVPMTSPDPPVCAANARAYAADPSVVGVIGAYQSICTGVELPALGTAAAGPVAVASPSNTYVGLTHEGPQTGPNEPDRYFPTGVRNYVRLSSADDAQGAALAELARQLDRRRLFVLDDGDPTSTAMSTYVQNAARALGLHVAGASRWSGDGPYTRLARRIRHTHADAVVLTGCICSNGGALVVALRHGLGPRVPFLASDNFTCGCDMAGPGAPPEGYGMYITGAGTAPPRVPAPGKAFLHRVFPHRSLVDISSDVSTAAQTAEVLLDAIAASNGTRADIVAQLTHNRVSTSFGTVAFDANGDPVHAPFTVYRVTPHAPMTPHLAVQGRVVNRVINADVTLSD